MQKDSAQQESTIVILGAGPAGLACAHRLLEKNPRRRVVMLDRAPVPGGSGASFRWKNHTLDYGPHAFHTRGDAPENLIRGLFGDNPSALIEGHKKVRVFLRGKFFTYPLQVKEALLKFNPFVSAKIITEFLLTSVVHLIVSIPVESFEDWGRKRFGATLYRMSFGDYTRKVWKTDPNHISKKFASEKIQGFSFINLVKKLFRIGGQVTEPYYQTWIYHRHGSGAMFDQLAKRVEEMGAEIKLGAEVTGVEIDGHRVASVSYRCNGVEERIPAALLINTIQLPAFIGILGDQAPFVVRHHADKLRYISLVLVYLEFEVDKLGDDNWFYLLDKGFVFNRITEQKNLSAETMENGKTVLSFELTCRDGDEYWQMSDQALYELAVADCRQVPLLAENLNRLTDFTVRRARNVYELYVKHFDAHAELVLGYVQDIENAISIGRRGMFLQGDMHQSVEMGLALGDKVIDAAAIPCLPASAKRDYFREYVKYIDEF